jgi:hypothetical protein
VNGDGVIFRINEYFAAHPHMICRCFARWRITPTPTARPRPPYSMSARQWETEDQYLSGDVRAKLAKAQDAARTKSQDRQLHDRISSRASA